MKSKIILFVIFIIINSIAFGQDWNQWHYEFKFKLNTTNTIRYDYKDFEVFINESYNYDNYQSSTIRLDSITQEYTIQIMYGCISCGCPNCDRPPEIYIKINLDNDHPYDKPFSTLIPIYFQKSKYWENDIYPRNKTFNIGTINIENFLTDDLWVDKIETYEVIEIIAPDSIIYRKKGEYTPLRMNKLINVNSI